jgi:hypothetical protein
MGLKDIISSVTNGKTSAADNLEKLKVGEVSTSDAKFPKTPGDIKLGMMVQDSLTGCFGTASSRHNMSSGNIQFGVQPVGDGVNYPEAWSFDWNQLLILGDHLSARAAKPASIKFALGDRVKDKISGFEGIITEISTFFNGCVFAGVVSSKLGEVEGKPLSQTLASHRIEVIEPAETAKVLDIPKAVKTGDDKALAKGTGGPSRRVERVR